MGEKEWMEYTLRRDRKPKTFFLWSSLPWSRLRPIWMPKSPSFSLSYFRDLRILLDHEPSGQRMLARRFKGVESPDCECGQTESQIHWIEECPLLQNITLEQHLIPHIPPILIDTFHALFSVLLTFLASGLGERELAKLWMGAIPLELAFTLREALEEVAPTTHVIVFMELLLIQGHTFALARWKVRCSQRIHPP